MGYYDFIPQGAGMAPDIREDYGTILDMLRQVEELAGLSLTTWHPDFEPGNPTGPQQHQTAHYCVAVGGDPARAYLPAAIDRVRAALGVPPWPWDLCRTICTTQEDWRDRRKGGLSFNDILFFKLAVGRATSSGAVVAATLHFTLADDLETVVVGVGGSGYMNGTLTAATSKEADLLFGGVPSNGYQGSWSEDGAGAGTYTWTPSGSQPEFDEEVTLDGGGSLGVRILDSDEGGSVDEEPIEEEFPELWQVLGGGGGGPITAKVRTTLTRGSYIVQTQADKFAALLPSGGDLAHEEGHSEFETGDPANDAYVEEAVELLSSDTMPTTWAEVVSGAPGTAGRYVWVKPPATLIAALSEHLPNEHESHTDYEACRDTLEGWSEADAEAFSAPYKANAVFGSSTVHGRVDGQASYSWTRGVTVTVVDPSSIPAAVTGWIYWLSPATPTGWPWSLIPS